MSGAALAACRVPSKPISSPYFVCKPCYGPNSLVSAADPDDPLRVTDETRNLGLIVRPCPPCLAAYTVVTLSVSANGVLR